MDTDMAGEPPNGCGFDPGKFVLKLKVTLAADRNAIDPVVQGIMEVVRDTQCAMGKEEAIELALSEALANAVVHGAKGDINKVIENRFVEEGRNPGDIPLFSWIPANVLMQIDTGALPTAGNVPDGAAGPGDPVPVGSRLPLEKMSLRFETRNATTHAPLAGSGKVLNAMIVNNNPIFLKLAMREHLDSGDFCGIINGIPHIAYTAYHPYLQAVNLNVRSNSGAYNHNMNDAPQNLPLSGNANDAIVNLNNPNLEMLPHPTTKCTYIVTLGAQSRRHTGDGQVNGENAPIVAFYWEP